MSAHQVMVLAGETSGDTLAAELINELRDVGEGEWEFFGAGGERMRAAGAEIAIDLTQHAVVGVWEALRHYKKFKRFFDDLLALALKRRPETVVFVDNPGFNLRLARALRRHAPIDWRPRLVYYISPQLWAWHESRVHQMAADLDLLLSIFPFEKEWYAERAPGFRVEFVGHPFCDRHRNTAVRPPETINMPPRLLLLPGSRAKEVSRHLPVMEAALGHIGASAKVNPVMVLPNESLAHLARERCPATINWDVRTGGLAEALSEADVAIASSGTVTLECAWFRVPTVVLYKTSWPTYLLGRAFVKVPHIAMPNVLAGREVFPEFIQGEATAERMAVKTIEFLKDVDKRRKLRVDLDDIAGSLGEPGAARRAAKAVFDLMQQPAWT